AAPPLGKLTPVGLPPVGGTDAVDGVGAAQGSGGLLVEAHQRATAVARRFDGLHQHAAVADDAPVGAGEVLARAILDDALRFAGELIVDVDVRAHARVGLRTLLSGVEAVLIAAVED